jgi:hypothetical protein
MAQYPRRLFIFILITIRTSNLMKESSTLQPLSTNTIKVKTQRKRLTENGVYSMSRTEKLNEGNLVTYTTKYSSSVKTNDNYEQQNLSARMKFCIFSSPQCPEQLWGLLSILLTNVYRVLSYYAVTAQSEPSEASRIMFVLPRFILKLPKIFQRKFGIRTVCIKFVRRVSFLFILVQYNLFYI